jgi:hypothetical protein
VVVGYVIMPEHIYLFITEPEIGTPSTVMQGLKRRTAHALLPKRKRSNPRQRHRFGEEPQRILGGALLRFQPVDDEEARGETTLHASQPGKARHGARAGAMALE